MKIDELIRRVVDDKRSAILLSRNAVTGTKVAEVAYEVMQDPALAGSLALIRDDPFDLKEMIRGFIRGRVGAYMRSVKYTDSGVRQWESVPLLGRRERRWMPTRGMMLWQWEQSGQAKIRAGSDTIYEGRLLVAMADMARQRGYADNEVVRSGDFEVIVRAAKLALA